MSNTRSDKDKPTEQGAKNDVNSCSSFTGFVSWIDDLLKNYTPLNPKNGDLREVLRGKTSDTLNETGMAFVRGGVVAVVATWENYVQDLFKEAFEILIEVGSGQQENLEDLSKIWPDCRKVIQSEYKRRVAAKKHEEVEAYELLFLEDKTKKKVWMQLLHTHCQNVLGKTIVPIFSHRDRAYDSVDRLFHELFKDESKEKNCSLSQLIIESGDFKFDIIIPHCSITLNDDKSSLDALHNISRLYYGLRCALVHGNQDITIQGVLQNFPDTEDRFPLPDRHSEYVKSYYTGLYLWIKDYGRNIWLHYRDFVNITRFYKIAAKCLKVAVAKRLCQITKNKVQIWDFVPAPQI